MAKRRTGRPGTAKNKAKQAEAELVEDEHVENQAIGTPKLRQPIVCQVYWALLISCYSGYFCLLILALSQGLDVQFMLFLQWDAALEQWASMVSPRLASPHLSMAFFMFQDAAFICALAWSVIITRLFLSFHA